MKKSNDKKIIILKKVWRKILTYRATPISLSSGSSAETLQPGKEWNVIFKILKYNSC